MLRSLQANCWFFVSLLQQHLAAAGDGFFLYGSLPHPTLAQEIREKVNERLRLLYHMPAPMPSVATVSTMTRQSSFYRLNSLPWPSSETDIKFERDWI